MLPTNAQIEKYAKESFYLEESKQKNITSALMENFTTRRRGNIDKPLRRQVIYISGGRESLFA